MPNRNKKQTKRIRNLIIITALSAIIFTVSTYAWFVGSQMVNVTSFDIDVVASESLLLSLDAGASWSDTVSISEATINTYDGNTNSWGGRGLIPISSIGEMDDTVSRMILFEKASLTHTPGGYRLMASRVNNFDSNDEQEGYVVFDLFIKNFSGTQYIKELNILDEESIFLTVDSEVTVAAAGAGGVADTGIENSVRVAFAQIGRVAGDTTDTDVIAAISCNPDSGDYPEITGICRKAQIWEPNDRDHVQHAINYYQTSCLKRIGQNVRDPESYTTDKCGSVVDGKAYPTYAVAMPIYSSDNVDVYDAPEYNGYTPDPPVNPPRLVAYSYFTDTMKYLRGTDRPEFMRLAPNSITKVRIYIYIEGQDIDNYDFASIGRKITVKFGFTKQRFTEDDIEYDGPDVNQGQGPDDSDKTPPVITLIGDNPLMLTMSEELTEYSDPGATAVDNVDGELIDENAPEAYGTVDVNEAGTYYIVYKVKDSAGNLATKTRTVIVQPSGQ